MIGPNRFWSNTPLLYVSARPALFDAQKKCFKRWKIQHAEVDEQLFGYSTCIIEVLTEMRITSEINPTFSSI